MIIKKGANVWYWPTANSPAPLNLSLGASIPATIYKVASVGSGNAFAAVEGAKLDLQVAGAKSILRGVPFVSITPTAEQLVTGFCGARAYVPPPLPMTFDQALAQVKLGKTIQRPGTALKPEDIAAADWIAR